MALITEFEALLYFCLQVCALQYHPVIANISQPLWPSQTPSLNTEKFLNGVLGHILWLESGC